LVVGYSDIKKKVILTVYGEVWRDRPAMSINALDHYDPFVIARLFHFLLCHVVWSLSAIVKQDRFHLKPSFFEVIDICSLDAISCDYVLSKRKPMRITYGSYRTL